MKPTTKCEMFFATEIDAREIFRQLKSESPLYNLIRFKYLGVGRETHYYLVTPSTFMTVVCEVSTYLGMLARYSCRKFGYEPTENGYFLASIELIDM